MQIPNFDNDATFDELYGPAMKIETQEDADEYLEALIKHIMQSRPCNRYKVLEISKYNLGYWTGYFDEKTAERMCELFKCVHPIYGNLPHKPTPEELFQMRLEMGKKIKESQEQGLTNQNNNV